MRTWQIIIGLLALKAFVIGSYYTLIMRPFRPDQEQLRRRLWQ